MFSNSAESDEALTSHRLIYPCGGGWGLLQDEVNNIRPPESYAACLLRGHIDGVECVEFATGFSQSVNYSLFAIQSLTFTATTWFYLREPTLQAKHISFSSVVRL